MFPGRCDFDSLPAKSGEGMSGAFFLKQPAQFPARAAACALDPLSNAPISRRRFSAARRPALGVELRHSREQKERVGLRLSALTQADPELHALGATSRVTTGLLIAEGLDPRAYANSKSYCKALGLTLKESSSGQHIRDRSKRKKGKKGVRALYDMLVVRPSREECPAMPRKPRFKLAGMPVHVVQRGNNRQAVFYDEQDHRAYLRWLEEGAGRYG